MVARPSPIADASTHESRTWPFFVAALGFTWLLQLPAVLAKFGIIAGSVDRFMLPALLGGFGPLLAALFAARIERSKPGAWSIFQNLRTPGVGAGWYLIALGTFTAIYVAAVAIYKIAGGSEPLPWLYPPENAQHVSALLVMPFVEEPAWRGFALPRLQQRFGALEASLRLGILWALWHTAMFILQGTTAFMFVVGMLNVCAGSVVFSWLYNHTRGSLAIALFAHVGVHLNNPFHALLTRPTSIVVYTLALVVVAVGLVIVDSKIWRPRDLASANGRRIHARASSDASTTVRSVASEATTDQWQALRSPSVDHDRSCE